MRRPNIQYDTVVFLFLLVVVFISKFGVLNTPYYWDEMGWVRSAHWLSEVNLLRAIPGLHPPAAFWGHPPALYLSLASLFKLFGDSIWLSHLLIICFSFLGVYFTYLLGSFLYGLTAGIFSALFLFFSGIYFAQSGMFLGDIPVATLGVMSVYFALRKKYIPYLLCAIYMVMVKETGAAVVFSLMIYLFLTGGYKSRQAFREVFKYGVPLLVIAAFFILQKFATGKFCCIYPFEFHLFELRAESAVRQASAITEWLFFYQHRYVFTLSIALNLILNKASRNRKELLLFLLIVIFSGYTFSFIYFLPRYLLPVLPFFYMAGAWSLTELIKSKKLQTAAGIAIAAALIYHLSDPVMRGNNEVNMKYLDAVKTHKTMCEYIEEEFPGARVLTVFPHTEQLLRPYLGYVNRPLKTTQFKKEKNFGGFDLIFLSSPADRNGGALRGYAIRNNLTLLKRLEKDGVISELYDGRRMK